MCSSKPGISDILEKYSLSKDDIITLLHVTDSCELEKLYRKADEIRREYMGDKVHLRGIIEFSNYCARWCHYCGLRSENKSLQRYRMEPEEILDTARKAFKLGYKTVVLQSGEDNYYTVDLMEEIILLKLKWIYL